MGKNTLLEQCYTLGEGGRVGLKDEGRGGMGAHIVYLYQNVSFPANTVCITLSYTKKRSNQYTEIKQNLASPKSGKIT